MSGSTDTPFVNTQQLTITLRLKIFRHSASQVRTLPRVYALVCKRSKQVRLKMLTAKILSVVGTAALSEPSSNLGGITGSTEYGVIV